MRAFEKWVAISQKCLNSSYLDNLIELMVDMSSRDQEAFPFIFLCAPSGAGKTTLAYNLGTRDVPFLYFLFNYKLIGKDTQEKYKPFTGISDLLMDALTADVESLEEIIGTDSITTDDVDTTSIMALENANGMAPFEFHSAGLILSLYRYVDQVKKENPIKTWIEVQSSISKVRYVPTSI